MDEELYKQNILDHNKSPRNKGGLVDCDYSEKSHNTTCGDDLVLSIKLKNNVVDEVMWEGNGCAISTAAASMLTEYMKGKTLDDLRLMTPGYIYDMLGIPISPARSRCALLSYDALENMLKKIDR